MQVREGLYYNPYFVGGAIAMPKMLADGGTEYDDGTDATEAQQAKVSLFFALSNTEVDARPRTVPYLKVHLSRLSQRNRRFFYPGCVEACFQHENSCNTTLAAGCDHLPGLGC